MRPLLSKIPILLLTLSLGVIASSTAYGTATIVIQNNDLPGVGFNDTTPATPIGGNSGTTVGQQRLNAFQFAADVWGATLVSGPIITIQASWAAQTCTSNSGILGSSSNSGQIWRDIPGAIPGTWYGNALANALTNTDLNGANPEINAQFNFNIGTPGCLENSHWYYGLDNNHANGIDLVVVLLHEFAHGLGFQTYTNTSTGQQAGSTSTPNSGFPSIYDKSLFDDSTSKTWDQMTDAERTASAINTNNLVWNGAQVTSDGTFLSSGKDSLGHPQMYAPNPREAGSSVSHWSKLATPNQLMEPSINGNLGHGVTVASSPPDLTFSLMRDIGWCSGCPQPPPPSPTPTPSPPPNDNFANAQIMSGCSGSVTGTNLAATKESGEPIHLPASPGSTKSVWYKWQAPSSGSVTIDTKTSNFDTVLAVYTGNSFPLTFVANDDDSGGTFTSLVTFSATAGIVYRIAVDGYDNSGSRGDTGNIVLHWTESGCSVTAPALLLEENTSQAAAVDSVTLTRGPFSKLDTHNFSSDQITRLMLFTSNLGLGQGENPGLSVQIGGVSVPIENVGTLAGQPQFSYIVVRLDPVVSGFAPQNVTVTLHGATSNIGTVTIQ